MRSFNLYLLISLYLSFIAPSFALAEQDRLQPNFTFKRVKPPRPGQKRIRVQVAPKSEAPAPIVPVKPAVKSQTASWFWQPVKPERRYQSPNRLGPALLALKNAPNSAGRLSPRLDMLHEIVRDHGTDILTATLNTDVSPALALSVISVESAGKRDAVSSAGATGLMQLMPATAERFGVKDRANPKESIKGGVAYLDWLLSHFEKDPILTIAAYNAGEGSIRDHKGVPPYKETRAYVPKVLAAWQVARGLCLTPPELITDGCVFIKPEAQAQ